MNHTKKKELHFVLSLIGGCGKTMLASQLADARNALVCDINPSRNDLMNFGGLTPLMDTSTFYVGKQRGGYGADIGFFFEDISAHIGKHFMDGNTSSVVVDTDTSFGLLFLRHIIQDEKKVFSEIYNDASVSIYFHVILAFPKYEQSKRIFSILGGGYALIGSNSIIVWMNENKTPFPYDFEMEKEKEDIEKVLGEKLKAVVHIGDEAYVTKDTVDRYSNFSTHAFLKENKPEGLGAIQMARIRVFDEDFKEKIKEVLGSQEIVANGEEEAVYNSPLPHQESVVTEPVKQGESENIMEDFVPAEEVPKEAESVATLLDSEDEFTYDDDDENDDDRK